MEASVQLIHINQRDPKIVGCVQRLVHIGPVTVDSNCTAVSRVLDQKVREKNFVIWKNLLDLFLHDFQNPIMYEPTMCRIIDKHS